MEEPAPTLVPASHPAGSDQPEQLFRTVDERAVALSPLERAAVLNLSPAVESVGRSHYFDNYNLPCPIRVAVGRRDGKGDAVVLRQG